MLVRRIKRGSRKNHPNNHWISPREFSKVDRVVNSWIDDPDTGLTRHCLCLNVHKVHRPQDVRPLSRSGCSSTISRVESVGIVGTRHFRLTSNG